MLLLMIAIALPLTVLNIVFSVEVISGLRERKTNGDCNTALSVTIVMPAHNESAILADTLTSLRANIPDGWKILVIADNCTDNTDAVARSCGADVCSRNDPRRFGKGYALSFARDRLVAASPDVVVVLDADCVTDRASLVCIVDLANRHDRPIQAVSLLRPDLSAEPMVQVSNFAFAVKNLVRHAGLQRLTGHAHLTGTGMAFPWHLFRIAPLATDDVVEDLRLGLDLAALGYPPLFAPGARVWSAASSKSGTLKQRTRWEGGFVSTSMRRSLPIAAQALRRGDPKMLWWGLSLMVPPLSLLALANLAVCTIAGAMVFLGAWPVPLAALIVSGVVSGAAIIHAWRKMGKPYLSGAAALRMPFYIVWKLPLYLGILKGSPRTWLRPGR